MNELMQFRRWRTSQVLRPLRRNILRHLYQDNNRQEEDSILVAGTARSGTTWLGDLLAEPSGRILFEPFHSGKIPELHGLSYFPYLRPNEENPQLTAFCHKVFMGTIRHRWIDREIRTLRPTFRVIKEVRANLFLKWLHTQFPHVAQLLIIRHPCAVVLSRLQLRWATDSDISSFLEQTRLIEDHLAPYLDTIHQAHTDIEKHAIIWCISHLVPLRQFQANELGMVFYEHLCVQPLKELARIERIVQRPVSSTTVELLAKPSPTTTASSAVLTGENRVTHWQKKLSNSEVRKILDIVEAFELDYLYGSGFLPKVDDMGDMHGDLA